MCIYLICVQRSEKNVRWSAMPLFLLGPVEWQATCMSPGFSHGLWGPVWGPHACTVRVVPHWALSSFSLFCFCSCSKTVFNYIAPMVSRPLILLLLPSECWIIYQSQHACFHLGGGGFEFYKIFAYVSLCILWTQSSSVVISGIISLHGCLCYSARNTSACWDTIIVQFLTVQCKIAFCSGISLSVEHLFIVLTLIVSRSSLEPVVVFYLFPYELKFLCSRREWFVFVAGAPVPIKWITILLS